MSKPSTDKALWQTGVTRLKAEAALLDEAERAWISDRLRRIALLQDALHALFLAGDGEAQCRSCLGACCAHGKHHLTLANLLAYVLAGESPPEPDYAAPCPMLGPRGCLVQVSRRPFNCITFACEGVEERMGARNAELFYAHEKRLRRVYEEFSRRYAAGSLCGMLIALQGLDGRALLGPS